MSAQSQKSEAPDQLGLYLLLAEILHLEINPRMRELLLQKEVVSTLQRLDEECEEYLSKEWDNSDYEEAATAFCSQFILAESESIPRAAAWLDTAQTKIIEDVVFQFITQWEIEVPPTYQKLAYDHLSLLLYISSLIRNQDSDLAKEFDDVTLSPWLSHFGASLASSSIPVYRAIGKILHQELH